VRFLVTNETQKNERPTAPNCATHIFLYAGGLYIHVYILYYYTCGILPSPLVYNFIHFR